ncbi:Ig-like domain-containing protein [Paludisphaera mucosa]|uniref:Ig-like domain-containing protein n=1 Tax=Paludisphaera mucosa TaxID=3030827 RepID=A0ABT6FCS7_9BACT|nr:Ig-like domain-containing protein [Paludisphaera mucosa]MDG3005369.1 Ig-like domain-containing protein [Paludisphaera mucosa]
MNESRELQRNRRKPALAVDALEDRRVLSAGMGSTFAIVPGTVTTAGQASSVQVSLDSTHFTPGARGRITIGIDVAADPNASVKPIVSAVKGANGRGVSVQHSTYSKSLVKSQGMLSPQSSAVTTTVTVPKAGQAPASYKVDVKGQTTDTGAYLLGFYLPGDSNGDGIVDKTDLSTIASKFGQTSTDSGYAFDSDANRDGKIDAKDLRLAGQNVGAKTIISPVTSVNLDPASDAGISDRITNQRVVTFNGSASPDATVVFTEVNGNSPGATTTVGADGKYSINVQLGDGSNTFKVAATDSFGQTITGSIAAVTYSTNPPTVVNTVPTTKTA